jgi:pyridoxine kinase
MTGVGYCEGKTGVAVYTDGKMSHYEHDKLGKGAHGTGDIYASAFTGALMNDKSIFEAARIAADYTVKCIINTRDDADHWYGAKFETALRDLMDMLA